MHRKHIKYGIIALIVVLSLIGTIILSTSMKFDEEIREENMTAPTIEDGLITSANNNYEYKTLLYNGKFADSMIDISSPWSIDMLSYPSGEFNNELALIASVLSGNAYHQETFLENSDRLGFLDVNFKNYDNPSIFKPAVAMSYSSQMVNGQTANVFLVAIRGTSDTDDVITDIEDGEIEKFFHSAKNIENEVLAYMCREMNCTPDELTDRNNIFLVVGHSLGGATANALSVLLEHDKLSSKDTIFTYTFESPQTYNEADIPFSHNGMLVLPKNKDASNAFNIINDQDVVPLVSTDALGRYGSDIVFNQENLSDGEYSALSLLSEGKMNVESLKKGAITYT